MLLLKRVPDWSVESLPLLGIVEDQAMLEADVMDVTGMGEGHVAGIGGDPVDGLWENGCVLGISAKNNVTTWIT